MDSNDLDFLANLRKSLFTDNTDAPNQRAGIQRKSLAQIYNHGLTKLDEHATCYLLEDSLEKYCDTMDRNTNLSERVRSILRANNVQTPLSLESELQNIDLESMLKRENCYKPNTFTCPKSEIVIEADLNNFTKLCRLKPHVVKTKPVDRSHITRTKSDENASYNTFKSASAWNEAPSFVRKRKLGIGRNTTKFVPPMLANSAEEEKQKPEVDERLKNIDAKMVELIKSEIMDVGAGIEWTDIAGLEFAKTAIQEIVVWPMLRPDIFTGLRRPPKGILLFGPPGTGKTLIGKCVASQSKSTFFSVSASSLTSKWVGDGEKMVRALFAVARCHQPAVIFIDEIDSLLSQRNETEHESSRRIKTEFLVQLDGATTDNEERLLLIGATNRPQELDEAARRRFVKRLYIPLPEYKARLQLVHKLVSKERHTLTEPQFDEVAQLSDGYSGADIRNLCSEASLGPIRSIRIDMIEKIQANEVRGMTMDDFYKAFTRVKSSVSPKDLEQYTVWDKTYGSGL